MKYAMVFVIFSAAVHLIRSWYNQNNTAIEMVPKDVKRRFKGIFTDRDGNDSNRDSSRNGGNDPESHSPVTYTAKKQDANGVDSTAFIPREESKRSDEGDGGAMSNVTKYLKTGVQQVSSGVANGAKAIKEKVVGKSAKKATLVEDDDDGDEDPCQYSELNESNPDKKVSEAVRTDMEHTRIWTPNGPILVDKHGNKIADPKLNQQKKSETYDASRDDSEESPVAILSAEVNYDERAAVMDPLAEYAQVSDNNNVHQYASIGNETQASSGSEEHGAASTLRQLYK